MLLDVREFKKLPIMGILRGISEEMIEPLTQAIIASGLRTIEIAMNTPHAATLIKRVKELAGDQLVVGAGTVLSMESLESALKVRASFIVLPTLQEEVVGYCVKNRIPVFPGALSPQEIFKAWRAGATMVKVFPAKFFGPNYFREIKGPLDDVELLACGGVNKDTVKEYFAYGASAVAFGSSIVKAAWLKDKEFKKIEKGIEQLISAKQ